MTLQFLPEAEDELREAADWYERRQVGLGDEFLAAVNIQLQEILFAPSQFALSDDSPSQ